MIYYIMILGVAILSIYIALFSIGKLEVGNRMNKTVGLPSISEEVLCGSLMIVVFTICCDLVILISARNGLCVPTHMLKLMDMPLSLYIIKVIIYGAIGGIIGHFNRFMWFSE